MKQLKVTAVSYLNTKPLLYGLLHSDLQAELDLELNIPSVCAQKLKDGEVDLGLVPVAIIPELANPHIISDYCIGTVGAVQTVCIFSEVPIEEVKTLYLDYHSRTSVELTKILVREHWKTHPRFVPAEPGFEAKIEGTTAALVIGDRAIDLLPQYPFCYDLGAEWENYTGLPFVFAAWISNRPLPTEFIQRFNAALAEGLRHIPQLMLLLPPPRPDFDLEDYFTNAISYELDQLKRQALSRFLREMNVPLPQMQGGI